MRKILQFIYREKKATRVSLHADTIAPLQICYAVNQVEQQNKHSAPIVCIYVVCSTLRFNSQWCVQIHRAIICIYYTSAIHAVPKIIPFGRGPTFIHPHATLFPPLPFPIIPRILRHSKWVRTTNEIEFSYQLILHFGQ